MTDRPGRERVPEEEAAPYRVGARHGRSIARRACALLGLVLLAGAALTPRGASADETYRNLIERSTESLRHAERARNTGDEATANATGRRVLDYLTQADRLSPNGIEVPFLGVQAAVFASDAEAGNRWYRELRQRSPHGERDPNLHFAGALISLYLLDPPRPDLAIEFLERMQALQPRQRHRQRDILYYAALIDRGTQLARRKDHNPAIRLFRLAAIVARRNGDRPRELTARGNIGITYQMAEDLIQAEEVFTALNKDAPNDILWHWYLGVTIANNMEFVRAIPWYENVIEMFEKGQFNPQHRTDLERVYLRIGNCYRNLGNNEASAEKRAELIRKAHESIAHYVELRPKDNIGHYWLGLLLYEEMDRPYEAMEYLKKAYEIDPVCDGSLRLLIQISRDRGPPAVDDPKEMDKVVADWIAERKKWERDLDENSEARKKEREKREEETHDGTAGCI